MNKDWTITRLLHELTQKRVTVSISHDFNGMLTVSFFSRVHDIAYHEHLGNPYQDLKLLEKQLSESLSKCLENFP
jgi:subtilisin-like proprotein convertase family protein